MPPFSRHPMFGPMPPVSKLLVAETAFCWRKSRHYELFADGLASARGWVCLYNLAATQATTTGDRRAQGFCVPVVGLATKGPRSGPFATLEKAGTGWGGRGTHLNLNGVRPRSEALPAGLQRPPN